MYDNSLDYLLDLADDLKIKVIQRYTDNNGNYLPPHLPSAASAEQRKILLNMNWYNPQELPLILGHEISHIINGDTDICYYNSLSKIKTENIANKMAINMLMDYYFDDLDNDQINIETFMDYYQIPQIYYCSICDSLKRMRQTI